MAWTEAARAAAAEARRRLKGSARNLWPLNKEPSFMNMRRSLAQTVRKYKAKGMSTTKAYAKVVKGEQAWNKNQALRDKRDPSRVAKRAKALAYTYDMGTNRMAGK